MSSIASAADYAAAKADVLSFFNTYNTVLQPLFFSQSNWSSLEAQAIVLGDKATVFIKYKTAFISDTSFHDTIFKIRTILETLNTAAAARDDVFELPASHSGIRLLTRWIHETRSVSNQTAVSVVSAINSSTATVPFKPKRSNRKSKGKSAVVVLDSSDEDNDQANIGGDITMKNSSSTGDNASTTEKSATNDATVLVSSVPKGLHFKKKEPVVKLNPASSKPQAVETVQKADGSRKRLRTDEYLAVSEDNSLAFPNSKEQLTAAASSSTGAASSSILDKAAALADHRSSSSTISEAALARQEADIRAELDVLIHKISYLLSFFEILKDAHVKVLKELHISEQPTADN
ncbi:hypothetical protein D9757_009793 [Collybiopsis confluens]|uniref:Uncharacterized protein n=1 Tax=Collybiopsis confluens TaxID=2823264 RepID=A0A8H5GXE4_9AGAR|nr:hypothetical protein D9757_011650 [Collybiopsis confluens]KAF5382373.1 hypothetical protein D9757_009793 [Collybiopsis confluens]